MLLSFKRKTMSQHWHQILPPSIKELYDQNYLPKAITTVGFHFDRFLSHAPVNLIIRNQNKHAKVTAPKVLLYVIV